MVNLRRGPRLQRQCNITQKEEIDIATVQSPAKTLSSKTKGSKVNTKNRQCNNLFGATVLTPAKKLLKDPKIINSCSLSLSWRKKKSCLANKQDQIGPTLKCQRSKRSRVEQTSELQYASTNDNSDGIIYRVGMRKTGETLNNENECVLKLSNSNEKKRKCPQFSAPLQAQTANMSDLDNVKNDIGSSGSSAKSTIKESKNKTSLKSPLRLSLKNESLPENDVFKSSRSSCKRQQRVSSDVASEVKRQEKLHSVCTLILNKQGKRKSDAINICLQDDNMNCNAPLFNGLSPIVTSKQEVEKLNSLEKSMNLFNCTMSPIANMSNQKSFDYSHLALKSNVKSLPKRAKTRPLKKLSKDSKTKPAKAKSGKLPTTKKENTSSLKTPLRQVFQSRLNNKNDTSLFTGTLYILLFKSNNEFN